jgi:quercetin dioxygenase-like cupin family protein
VGDVVYIPAEEKHWYGATPDSSFSHIALTAKGSTTTQWKGKQRREAGVRGSG